MLIDILWVLVAAGLVFLMQPGFMCLESGLTRSKNSINVAVKNLADFAVSVAIFWAFGYAFMFGVSQYGWIGGTGFLPNLDTSSLAAFFIFQAMFCGTATTIVSGVIAERVKFEAYLIISVIISSLIYPIFGHWAWNGADGPTMSGWLGSMGFVDFAGSTVVHSVGAWVGLASVLIIGPRLGRFDKGETFKIPASNLPLSVMGAMLLWVGWLGFNGGSTLTLNNQVPSIMVNTIMAAVAGLIAAATLSWRRDKLPEPESLINGSLAGLVAVTASCHAITTPSAVIIGVVGSWLMIGATRLLERWQVDDAVGAIPVHGAGGVWGTVAVALFGQPELLGTGLSFSQQLGIQFLGVLIAFGWAFGLSFLLLFIINRYFPLRVSHNDEKIGLNVSEHGAKTEVYDLLTAMDQQARTQDLNIRVPVEPFTEVGHIAERYNQVMDALREAVSRTEAVFKTATDAIITFTLPDLTILTANPSAARMFGHTLSELRHHSLADLLGWSLNKTIDYEHMVRELVLIERRENLGFRANGDTFPMETTVTEAFFGDQTLYIGTFRDISDRKQAEEALALANQEISGLNERLKAENVRLGAELNVTRELQNMLLPTPQELNQVEGLDIAAFIQPAEEVGGDYYDVLQDNGQIKLCIGDVSGHGLASGIVMLMTQTAVRTLLIHGETNPIRFLNTLNHVVFSNLQRMAVDKSLTLALMNYIPQLTAPNSKSGELYLSGQHETIIVVRQNGQIELVDTFDLGMPVGLDQDISQFINEKRIDLKSGDGVVLYTDGITEAENMINEQYGLKRLCGVISQNWSQSVEAIKSLVIDDVLRYVGRQIIDDDLTLVVVKQK